VIVNRTQPTGATSTPPITYLLLFLSLILIVAVLKIASSILIPFALAIFLAYLLYPVVDLLNRKVKIPYGIAVALVIALLVILFLLAGAVIVGELNSFAQALPDYLQGIRQYFERAATAYNTLIEKITSLLPGEPGPETSATSAPEILTTVVSNVFSGLMSAISLFSDVVLVLFMLVLLLADARIFKEKVIRAFGKNRSARTEQIVEEINRGIRDFIIIRTLINLGLAAVVTLVLLVLKIDYAYVWGPLTGLLNFIPYIGAFLAIIPPLVVALVTSPSYATPVAVLVCFIAIQNIEGNFLTPKLVGRKVNLNALAVLLSLILWGFIWGPIGMILSTPLTSCFKILCDHVEPLKPIGILLGGEQRPDRAG